MSDRPRAFLWLAVWSPVRASSRASSLPQSIGVNTDFVYTQAPVGASLLAMAAELTPKKARPIC